MHQADIAINQTRLYGHRAVRLLTTATVDILRSLRATTIHNLQLPICVNLARVRSNQTCPFQVWEACNMAPARACILQTRRLDSICLKGLLEDHRHHSSGLASTRHLSGGHSPSSRSKVPAPLSFFRSFVVSRCHEAFR